MASRQIEMNRASPLTNGTLLRTQNNPINREMFKADRFVNEYELKAEKMSVELKAPKINTSIRDTSLIVIFPKNKERLTRSKVEEIMSERWGPELYSHVIHFGNIDFSRRWLFHLDSHESNDLAVAKEIFYEGKGIKAFHATKKFNEIKVDWVPIWVDLNDLASLICGVSGVTGQFIDIRWARGDHVEKDSTQVVLRFYDDPSQEFNPPSYLHYTDEYGSRVFLHVTVIGKASKCMRCNIEGHIVANCPYFFCFGCGMLKEKDHHACPYKLHNEEGNNKVTKETSIPDFRLPENSNNFEKNITNFVNMSDSFSYSDKVREKPPKNISAESLNNQEGNWEIFSRKRSSKRNRHTPPSPFNPKNTKFIRQSTPKESQLEENISDVSLTLGQRFHSTQLTSLTMSPTAFHFDNNFPLLSRSDNSLTIQSTAKENVKLRTSNHNSENSDQNHKEKSLPNDINYIISDSASELITKDNCLPS